MEIDFSDIIIKDIQSLITVYTNPGEIRHMANRPTTGISFVSRGKLTYEIHGQHYISDPGHAVLLPHQGTYDIYGIDKSESMLINFLTDPGLDNSDIYSFNLSNTGWYLNYFTQMDNLWTFKKSSYKLRCLAGLYEILAKLNDSVSSSYKPNYKFEYIRPSIDFLEANYNKSDITNEILAEKSNISTVYFRKIFTEKYNVSPMKYIMAKRIEKAQDMLRGKYSTITSIAEATGFNSINHFSRAFKSITGYTPFEYSKMCINDAQSSMDKPTGSHVL